MTDSAYTAGLQMLARRELSEAQVRQRLARRGFAGDAIAEAIDRLKADGSIDDRRVAGALARTEAGVRHRGRLRVQQRLLAAGIPRALADHAVAETFDDINPEAHLQAALEKRLRLAGDDSLTDDRQFARLYRQLTAQGFEPDRVLAVLRGRRTTGR
jgi:regulatory protein